MVPESSALRRRVLYRIDRHWIGAAGCPTRASNGHRERYPDVRIRARPIRDAQAYRSSDALA
jgi:hypothetical protein